MLKIKRQVSHMVGTGNRARSATAGEVRLRFPTSGANGVSFKETNGQVRNIFQAPDRREVDLEIIDIRPVNRVVNRLKAKHIPYNILKLPGVRWVYFGIKTFKSVQLLVNLSSSKNTE